MADRLSVPERPINMKDSHSLSESPTELCDDCSQGTKDDLEPGYIEDRFRVDRKKLEQMLQGHQEHEEESAEDFFQRIMDETNTQITWPSKLKIGAKSKKDPHIKVIGFPEDVKAAKDSIMTILDTKSNRVTLKMDVSHTDHSHVIGKGGNNIKRVMQETGCHIHFPDSNRGNNVQEKSNQVSIAGQPSGVETARVQIRELLPLVYMFELPVTGILQPIPETSSPAIQQLQQQYSVTISFRQRPRTYVTTVIVRGSVCNAKSVKQGTARLMEHLTGNASVPLAVSMQLEIAPQHHLFIIGRGGVNVKQIMQRTGANIHFPDPNTVTPQRKGTFYITGNIESVYLARQHLIGCLPLVLMFDVKDEIDMDQARITHLMEHLDVFISVKPKPKQPSKSVIVKSIERNAPNMYLARSTLLGLKNIDNKNFPPSPVKGSESSLIPNNGLGLSALGFLSQNLLSVNTTNALLMLNGGQPSPGSLGSPQSNSTACSSPNHWVAPPPGIYGPMVVINPSTACSVQSQHDLMSHVGDLQQKDQDQNGGFVPSPREHASVVCNSENTSPARSPCSSPIGLNVSSADINNMQNMNAFSKMITRETSPSSSTHTLDLLGLSKPIGVQSNSLFLDNSLGRHSLEKSLSRTTITNGERSSESGAESDGSDKLNPNIEVNNTSSLFQSQMPFSVDYEQRKLMANKAMQKKPEGETRNPTDFWSGMGFSKSMPESAIREKFHNKKFENHYGEQNMATTYENPEEGGDIDRDPWKDSSCNKPMNAAPGEYPSPRKRYEMSLSSSNYVDSACLPSVKSLWTVKTDLAELFSKIGLGKYTDLFQQQEIDLATFLTLTDQDLRELGISTFGARRKMLLAITDLNKARTINNVDKLNNRQINPPPGLGTKLSQGQYNDSMPQPNTNQHFSTNMFQDSDKPSFPQSRAITGKQNNLPYQDGDSTNLHSSGMGLHSSGAGLHSSGAGLQHSGSGFHRGGLLNSSGAGLHLSGAGLQGSSSSLHSSNNNLHSSGHLSRKAPSNHFLDSSGHLGGPRPLTGGFSGSGHFQDFGQGLSGRHITGGLSASFQENGHSFLNSSSSDSPFVDNSLTTVGSRHSSRSDLASLSGRW